MKDFFTALQFLSRIQISRHKKHNWNHSTFSRSVPWFPLVGAVIGVLLAGANILLLPYADVLLRCVLLALLEILITGGLFCDGLMDTADGIFSGRDKDRILEIMKDSRVGANGVIAFVVVILLKIALYQAIEGELLTLALFAMPIVTRLAVVFAITHFKYARVDGTGGLFTKYTEKKYAYIAFFMATMLIAVTFSPIVYSASILCFLYCLDVSSYISKLLGGLTGDNYGFIAETGNVVFVFFIYLLLVIFNIFPGGIACLL